MVTVKREGDYLIFEDDGSEFYDRKIPCQADFELFMRDMTEKNWFANVLPDSTYLIAEYWGKA